MGKPDEMTTQRYKQIRKLISGGGQTAKLFAEVVEKGTSLHRRVSVKGKSPRWDALRMNPSQAGATSIITASELPSNISAAAEMLYGNLVLVPTKYSNNFNHTIPAYVHRDAFLVYLQETRTPSSLDRHHEFVATLTWTTTYAHQRHKTDHVNIYQTIILPTNRLRSFVAWIQLITKKGFLRNSVVSSTSNLTPSAAYRHPSDPCFSGTQLPDLFVHIHLDCQAESDDCQAEVGLSATTPEWVYRLNGQGPTYRTFPTGTVTRGGVYMSPGEALTNWNPWIEFGLMASGMG